MSRSYSTSYKKSNWKQGQGERIAETAVVKYQSDATYIEICTRGLLEPFKTTETLSV